MYGIPINPARVLLRYSVITESVNFAVLADTKFLVFQVMNGGGGGGGGTSGNGGAGGQTTFASYTLLAATPGGTPTSCASNGVGILGEAGLANVGTGGGDGGMSQYTGARAVGNKVTATNGLPGSYGGGGAGGGDSASAAGGYGGAAGSLSAPIAIINPDSSYAIAIGAGGAGGLGSGTGYNGGRGGDGMCFVWEYS